MFLGRAVAPGEALWTETDRVYALALLAYEADVCAGCGGSREETMQPESEGMYTGEAYKCHGCAAVARASDRFSGPKDDSRGLYISVHRRTKSGGVRHD